MKRLGMLICAPAPRLDLADDGFMGKVKLVTPHSPLQSVAAFFGNHGSGKVDSHDLPLGRQARLETCFPAVLDRRLTPPGGLVTQTAVGPHRVGLRARLIRAHSPRLR